MIAFELRSLLRDRRTILLAIVLPMLLLPALVLGQRAIEGRRDAQALESTYHYSIEAAADDDIAEIEHWLVLGLQSIAETERPHLVRAPEDDADLHIVLVRTAERPRLELRFEADREDSRRAMSYVAAALRSAGSHRTRDLLRESGYAIPPEGLVSWTREDVTPPSQRSGARIAPFLTMVMVVMLMLGGQVAACDIVAGERERGTLETLLTTAAPRSRIILAKLVTVALVALATTTINLATFAVGARLGLLLGLERLALGPLEVFLLALLYLPLAGLALARGQK